MKVLYWIAKQLCGDSLVTRCLTFVIGVLLDIVLPTVTSWLVAHFKNKDINERIRRRKRRQLIMVAIGGTALMAVTVLCFNRIYNSYYEFPQVITLKWDEAIDMIYASTGEKVNILPADGFTDDDDSYIFAVQNESGEAVSDGDLLKKKEKIYLFATFSKEKIDPYLDGKLTAEEMKEIILEKIAAEYTGDDLYVGQTIQKSNVRIVAIYSDKHEEEVNVSECTFDKTMAEKAGTTIFKVTWRGLSCNFSVKTREPVLTDIQVEYIGLEPMEGEQLDPADFRVSAVLSTGSSMTLDEGEYTISPLSVEAGDNEITVTYSTKTKKCKVHALAKGESRPIRETEPNDAGAAATLVSPPCSIDGAISNVSDVDIYEVKLPQAGRVDFYINSEMEYTNLSLYQSAAFEGAIWESGGMKYNQDLGELRTEASLYLSAGIYYLRVTGREYENSESTVGNYNLQLGFESADCTETKEHASLNQVKEQRLSAPLDQNIKDQISLTERNQYYCFTLAADSKVTLSTTSYMPCISWWLYNDHSTDAIAQEVNVEKKDLDFINNEYAVYLKAGTYYLRFSGRENDMATQYTGNFSFQLNAVPCEVSANDTLGAEWVKGEICADESTCQYTFSVAEEAMLSLSCESEEALEIQIVAENGSTVWSASIEDESRTFEEITLSAGNYAAVVKKNNDRGVYFKLRIF